MIPKAWPIPRIEYTPWSELVEPRPAAVVCNRAAFEAVQSRLRLNIVWKMEVVEASADSWRAGMENFQGDVVYAIGGGLAADAGKFISVERGLPLVSLPTALSVDAFFTWASGIRGEGCVRYIETKPPDRVIVDFDVWAEAPAAIRAGGICDVLSIATGLWDWRYAHERALNPPHAPYIPYVADAAEAILRGALECAESAGRGERDGLKQLLDTLALEVQLCNLIGHSRPEEGSEHYFAYAVENAMGKGLPHGDLVGPGILILAAIQGQDVAPLRRALRACHIPLRNIPWDVVLSTLDELPDYCRRHNLAYGIAHDLKREMYSSLNPDDVLGL